MLYFSSEHLVLLLDNFFSF